MLQGNAEVPGWTGLKIMMRVAVEVGCFSSGWDDFRDLPVG